MGIGESNGHRLADPGVLTVVLVYMFRPSVAVCRMSVTLGYI